MSGSDSSSSSCLHSSPVSLRLNARSPMRSSRAPRRCAAARSAAAGPPGRRARCGTASAHGAPGSPAWRSPAGWRAREPRRGRTTGQQRRERVDQQRQEAVGARAGGALDAPVRWPARAPGSQRAQQVGDQPRGIVVIGIERQPARRPGQLARDPRREQHGLAGPRRRGQQRQVVGDATVEAVQPPFVREAVGGAVGWVTQLVATVGIAGDSGL